MPSCFWTTYWYQCTGLLNAALATSQKCRKLRAKFLENSCSSTSCYSRIFEHDVRWPSNYFPPNQQSVDKANKIIIILVQFAGKKTRNKKTVNNNIFQFFRIYQELDQKFLNRIDSFRFQTLVYRTTSLYIFQYPNVIIKMRDLFLPGI